MRIADFAATVLMLSCLVLPTHVQARGDQMMKLENRFVAVELRGFTRRGALVSRKTARGRLRKAPGHGHPDTLGIGRRGRWDVHAVLHGIPTTRRRRTIQRLEYIPECRPIEGPADREQGIENEGNPHFPALRSDPMALSGASRRKRITSSQCPPRNLPFLPRSPVRLGQAKRNIAKPGAV